MLHDLQNNIDAPGPLHLSGWYHPQYPELCRLYESILHLQVPVFSSSESLWFGLLNILKYGITNSWQSLHFSSIITHFFLNTVLSPYIINIAIMKASHQKPDTNIINDNSIKVTSVLLSVVWYIKYNVAIIPNM